MFEKLHKRNNLWKYFCASRLCTFCHSLIAFLCNSCIFARHRYARSWQILQEDCKKNIQKKNQMKTKFCALDIPDELRKEIRSGSQEWKSEVEVRSGSQKWK